MGLFSLNILSAIHECDEVLHSLINSLSTISTHIFPSSGQIYMKVAGDAYVEMVSGGFIFV